jgi:4'-phosphopantetheinyl transferase
MWSRPFRARNGVGSVGAAERTMSGAELWFVDLTKCAEALSAIERKTPRLPAVSDLKSSHLRSGELNSGDAAFDERRLAHIALRILLERTCGAAVRGVPFARGITGKPSLAGTPVHFSLAHTTGAALIAVSRDGPVGVDLEAPRAVRIPPHRRPPIEALAVRIAGGALLAGHDADARFLNAWVRLEAFAKAGGTGIGRLLETVRPGRVDPSVTRGDVAFDASFKVRDLNIPGDLSAAVALEAAGPTPPLSHLPPSAAEIGALVGA